jgi:glycosyltransferase involved in cell wall biosynthesis
MNAQNLVFSHQRETVIALSRRFETIHIFTAESGEEELPKNVTVSLVRSKSKSWIYNFYWVYRTVLPYLLKNRQSVVFSHMTDAYAALISPITWILKMRHFLWYAHATNSPYLIWSSFFVTRIISSTSGSCNLMINRRKIRLINQGINENNFPFCKRTFEHLDKIIYYGRLDKSKNIHQLFQLVKELNCQGENLTLDIYGKPMNPKSNRYLKQLKNSQLAEELGPAIKMFEPIFRDNISLVTRDYDAFLNLYSGSLDKTLVEATLMGLPVVTWNIEYCTQFGTWSGLPAKFSIDFVISEFQFLKTLNSHELEYELIRRLDIATSYHSFVGWIERLEFLLAERTV